eukprot:scaffold67780_cov19-Tisochrysis_lutea.AAC.6
MLWPEVRKLYGHGDNLYCVSPSPDGALIASACVAKSATAALIWVWDTKDWKGVAQLAVSGAAPVVPCIVQQVSGGWKVKSSWTFFAQQLFVDLCGAMGTCTS